MAFVLGVLVTLVFFFAGAATFLATGLLGSFTSTGFCAATAGAALGAASFLGSACGFTDTGFAFAARSISSTSNSVYGCRWPIFFLKPSLFLYLKTIIFLSLSF